MGKVNSFMQKSADQCPAAKYASKEYKTVNAEHGQTLKKMITKNSTFLKKHFRFRRSLLFIRNERVNW